MWLGITKTTRQSDKAAKGSYVNQANTLDAKSKLKENAMGKFSLVDKYLVMCHFMGTGM